MSEAVSNGPQMWTKFLCPKTKKKKKLPEMSRFPPQVRDGESIIHLL